MPTFQTVKIDPISVVHLSKETIEALAEAIVSKLAIALSPPEEEEDEEEEFDQDGALSREYLLRRGVCCENGCKNCPYKENEVIREDSPEVRPEDRPTPFFDI